MKELNKKEVYSLEGLSEEQLIELSVCVDVIDLDFFKNGHYIRFNGNRWVYGNFDINHGNINVSHTSAKAIDLFEDEKNDKPQQYALGIDTFKRCEANMTKEEILACCKFNIDKYNWRKKEQDKEDFEKIINYAKWALEQL